MKKILFALVIICSISLVFTGCKSEKKEHVSVDKDAKEIADKVLYQCPMDCEKGKTYEKEGNCPVCKMKLRKKVDESEDSHDDH